jgi:hypothetical protein
LPPGLSPALSAANIGSETLAENITFLGSSSLFGFVASDVVAATGALAGDLGDIQGQLITPFGDVTLYDFDLGSLGASASTAAAATPVDDFGLAGLLTDFSWLGL